MPNPIFAQYTLPLHGDVVADVVITQDDAGGYRLSLTHPVYGAVNHPTPFAQYEEARDAAYAHVAGQRELESMLGALMVAVSS